MARKNTDKIDADILCRILKMQVLSGEKTISPIVVPPEDIQELRGFTQEEIFDKRGREHIRTISPGTAMHFQANQPA